MRFSITAVLAAFFAGSGVLAQQVVSYDMTDVSLDGPGIGLSHSNVVFIDIDGDSQLDMAQGLSYRLRTGPAAFGVEQAAGDTGFFADVDSDGDQDVVVRDDRVVGEPTQIDLVWRERDAGGEYLPEAVLALPPAELEGGGAIPLIQLVRFTVDDLNGDGVNDIARYVQTDFGLGVMDYITDEEAQRGVAIAAKLQIAVGASSKLDNVRLGPDLDGDGWCSLYVTEIDYGLASDGATLRRYFSNTGGLFGAETFNIRVDTIDRNDVSYDLVILPGAPDELAYVLELQTDYFAFPNKSSVLGSVSRVVGGVGAYTTEFAGQIRVEGLTDDTKQIGTVGARVRFAARHRMSTQFDADHDGDTDVLLELEYRGTPFGNVTQRYTTVFVNQGDGDFVGQFLPRVSVSGGGPLALTFIRDGDFGETLGDPDGDGEYEVLYSDGNRFSWIDVSVAAKGDLNTDGLVGFGDLAELLAVYGEETSSGHDLDEDGVVDADDVAQLLALWGQTTE